MSINKVRNTVSTSITTPTVSAAPARYYSVAQLESLLAKIESKYPKLDAKLAKERAILEDIKDSDTLAGLKWYEWLALPVFPLVLSANKQMLRQQKTLVASLENLVEERDNLRAILAPPADSFEVR